MAEISSDASPPAVGLKSSGSALLTLGGLAAAFGVAACCALPLLMISLGLGTAWLGGIASVAAPIRSLLLVFAAVALAAGAILLWRQQRHAATCGPNGVCTPPAARLLTLLGLILAKSRYIGGKDYSIADIAVFPWLRSWKNQGIAWNDFPHLKGWFDEIAARPAVKRGVEVLADQRRPLLDDKAREALFGSRQYGRR